MPPHLQRCQGFAVAHYSFTLGRLEAGAPSTFAQLEYKLPAKDLNFLNEQILSTIVVRLFNIFKEVITGINLLFPDNLTGYRAITSSQRL
jgi:hypothetical protein